MKGLEAASARNSANRKNLMIPACVGRDNMVVEKIRKCECLNPESKTTSVTDFAAKDLERYDWYWLCCLQQSKSPENLLRLGYKLQIADVAHFSFKSITGTSTLNLTGFMSHIKLLLITLSSRTTLFR
ncbi:hypothetical protein GIB67_040393 [Kingdonia uniflora]|uniref:Uncharacterized protein n=1 Tax=Kingdonia uniflora TaxID=39325 RepID=A0A7J7KXQ1_9MAGN|nr:hypothetical protein GIB67_040393 [Kingdonia uniflora]